MCTHVLLLRRSLWFISIVLSVTDSEVPQTLGCAFLGLHFLFGPVTLSSPLLCVILTYPGASLLGLCFLIHTRRGYVSVMLAGFGLGARWHRCSFLELHNLSSLSCSNRFYHSSEDLKPAIKEMAAGLPHDSFPALAVGSCWQTSTWGSLSVFKVPSPPQSLLVSFSQLYTYEETCHDL